MEREGRGEGESRARGAEFHFELQSNALRRRSMI